MEADTTGGRKSRKEDAPVETLSAQIVEVPQDSLSTIDDFESRQKTAYQDSTQKKASSINEEDEEVIPSITDIPDGGYGWLVVFACFLLNFNTWGANTGFAVYLSTYLNEGRFEGADKRDYATIGGITFGIGLIFAPVVIWTQGKVGIRATIIIGMFLQFTGLMSASFATKLWHLYLTQGLLHSFGLAFMSIPGMSILPQWFKKRRAFATALSVGGAGCGGIMYNLAMQKVIQVSGVSWALRAQSLLCFGMCWISIALIRTRMEVKFALFDSEIARSAGYYIAIFYVMFCLLGYVVVLFSMANYTTSLGYTAYQGSIASAMVQVGSILGRPLVGKASDKLGPITVACGAYFMASSFVFGLWIPARNYPMVLVFCVIEGTIMGSVFATIGPICAKLFGLRRVSVAFGMLWVFVGFAALASPVIGLSLKKGDAGYVGPGQYLHCSIFSGTAFAMACFTLLIMRGYVIYRHEATVSDADEGHMHVTVPFFAPFRCAFKNVSKV